MEDVREALGEPGVLSWILVSLGFLLFLATPVSKQDREAKGERLCRVCCLRAGPENAVFLIPLSERSPLRASLPDVLKHASNREQLETPPSSGTDKNVAMPHKREAVDPDHQNGIKQHMPAEESSGELYVIFVIIHPFVARDRFVQHKAYLH